MVLLDQVNEVYMIWVDRISDPKNSAMIVTYSSDMVWCWSQPTWSCYHSSKHDRRSTLTLYDAISKSFD